MLYCAVQVSTLFPSPETQEGVKGGVVLLRLQPPAAADTPLTLSVSWEDRAGARGAANRTVALPADLDAAGTAANSSYPGG